MADWGMKFVQAYGAMFGCDKKKEYVNYPNYDERKSNRGGEFSKLEYLKAVKQMQRPGSRILD